MNTYYVYILHCADGSYYTGVTNDIDRRMAEHIEGVDKKAYTYRRRPVKLVFLESLIDINEAIDFEKQIKGWTRNKKEALIDRNYDKLKELSKCINSTSHQSFSKDNKS